MALLFILTQSTPQLEGHPESIFLNVIIFFFLVMVVGLFGWILRELGHLRDKLSDNQSSLFSKLDMYNLETNKKFEEFRVQLAEHDSFKEILSIKLEHISEHLPDYALVFRKFSEIDDKMTDQSKALKKYDHQIGDLAKRLDELKDKKQNTSS